MDTVPLKAQHIYIGPIKVLLSYRYIFTDQFANCNDKPLLIRLIKYFGTCSVYIDFLGCELNCKHIGSDYMTCILNLYSPPLKVRGNICINNVLKLHEYRGDKNIITTSTTTTKHLYYVLD